MDADGSERHSEGRVSPDREVYMPSDLFGANDSNTPGRKPPVSAGNVVPERLLDSDEAARIMNVHPKTLQKLARKGVVRGLHIGKLWRFRASAIEDWIDRQMAG